MPFAIFWGCKTGYYQRGYKMATSAIIRELGIKAVELEFNCCGYPVRELYFEAFIQSAARNLALAGHEGLDVLTGCKCCFGNLKYADHYLREDTAMQKVVNRQLEKEGLTWTGQVGIHHLLSVLDQETGPEMIHDRVVLPLQGTRIAAHYGCQALRPSRITEFDNPLNPTIFERLVQATGATSVYWHRRLECCGDPVRIKIPILASDNSKPKPTTPGRGRRLHLRRLQQLPDAVQCASAPGRGQRTGPGNADFGLFAAFGSKPRAAAPSSGTGRQLL